ncbi:capsule biosynthesis protein [Sphingomonas gei]|uniref:Capsule biosynthesis protein n=1 Tax=Sphingomonas gei TaxID=1395960 RepID=A0A4V3QY24_9SPHN|nr:capsule biosynthesis protein [Sphingomonas gei]TGX48692.1 capsule biosynthesis protein [Sphingomonas gei]
MVTFPLHPLERETGFVEIPAQPAPEEVLARERKENAPNPHRLEQQPPGVRASGGSRFGWCRNFGLVVLLPTVLVALFQYCVVADQYESETHFVVRTSGSSGSASSGLGQLLGLEANPAAADNQTVIDYLLSHDAVARLERIVGLARIFRRPEADPFSRLRESAPPEAVLRYYREMVHIDVGPESGITRVAVRAFRPADAERVAQELLRIGEQRVNAFNQRLLENRLAAARESLETAERGVDESQAALTGFRQSGRDIDPERTSAARITMVTQMQAELAQARAQLNSMAGAIRRDSPQYVTMAARVRALEQQVGAAESSLTGSRQATAAGLGQFENLRLKQEFSAKRFETAAAALDAAREQAVRQQLFLVRVVEPNLPGKALYPKRLKLIATVFFALLLVYAIGWLILAGIREHAAS